MPLFTQKHYEYLIRSIRKVDWVYNSDREMFVGVLGEIFAEDNPKFKEELFYRLCKEKEEMK